MRKRIDDDCKVRAPRTPFAALVVPAGSALSSAPSHPSAHPWPQNVVKNETIIESCPGLPSCTTFGTPPVLSADGERLLVVARCGSRSGVWGGRWGLTQGDLHAQRRPGVLHQRGQSVSAVGVRDWRLCGAGTGADRSGSGHRPRGVRPPPPTPLAAPRRDSPRSRAPLSGRVVALHLVNGSEAWPAPFSVPVWTVNSTDGGTSQFGAVYSVYVPRDTSDKYVYVKDDSATIYALDYNTGACPSV